MGAFAMKTVTDKALKIRAAGKDDMPAILQLIVSRLKYDGKSARQYYARYFSGDKSTKDDLVLAAAVDDHVVGVSGYCVDDGCKQSCWLGWTAVAQEFSRNPELRVGSRLLEAVQKDLKRHRVHRLFVSTSAKNTHAILFYVRNGFGFEARLRDYYYPGEDQIIFSKDLAVRGIRKG